MGKSWLPSYLLLVSLWGGSYAVTDVALTSFTPAGVALWRAVIGAAFLTAVLLIRGPGLPRLGSTGMVRVLVLGTLTTAGQVSCGSAQLRLSSGMVAVLCSMTPLISVLFYWLRRTPIPPMKWVSVSLGVVGVGVLLSPTADLDNAGFALGILAAGLFAASGILAADFFPDSRFTATQLTVAQLAVTTVLLTPVIAVTSSTHASSSSPGTAALAALLALGVLTAGVGNVLFWRVLRTAGPVAAATTYQTVPVVAVGLGVVLLDESLSVGEVIGMALVLTGLLLLVPIVRAAATGTDDPHLEESLIGIHCEESCACGNLQAVRLEHARRVPTPDRSAGRGSSGRPGG